ncbi:G2/mitotic-specific cyclin-B [Leptopilina heterotoma]|uniref:G2/mitotic-specific cyclin-B n=1 Tax=Leptopilina heterotoma TaxID=63436 RepID=UPI001CA96875|nr:G2/mitotic-specific cyclin-B [Leptopilina heterotoma]
MALRNRTAVTNILNQENTKNAKSTALGVPKPSRRPALGEIGNKVTIHRGVDPIHKSSLLPANGQKKPTLKEQCNKETEKDKLPVQVVKPVVKTDVISEIRKEVELRKEVESFSSDLLEVEDIDEDDKENPILVSIYSNDIYDYLRKLEREYPVKKGFLAGQEVTPKMRLVLVDWLVEVHQQFRLMQETLYLTTSIIDRFLQAFCSIDKKRLQLVGVTAMFIASKYEEMYSPDISDFVYITDNAYSKMEILQMEMLIVRTLNYSFGKPLPLHFLRRYSKAGKALGIHHTMAKYFLELSIVNYDTSHYHPSLIAAAAIYLSFFVIGNEECDEGKQIWTSTLRYYTTYKREEVLPVVHEIASIVLEAEKSKYQAVRKKYTLTKHMRVSLRTELKSPTMIALAKKKQA